MAEILEKDKEYGVLFRTRCSVAQPLEVVSFPQDSRTIPA